jgi:hypothetical protein
VSQFAPYLGKTLDDGNKADATSRGDMRANMMQAAQRANEVNRAHPEGVTVYHAIVVGRGSRSVEDRLKFLTSKRVGEQQSVSVGALKNSLWDHNLVIVGTAKKLSYYWPTDIHTKPVPGNLRAKVPLDFHRPPDFRPYDEALVDLKDVTWHTIFFNTENPKAVEFASYGAPAGMSGPQNIRRLAKQFGMELRTPDSASPDEHGPLVHRYEAQKQIDKMTRYNVFLYQGIMQFTQEIKSGSGDHPDHMVSMAAEIEEHLQKVDVEHKDMIKYPEKRVQAMRQTFDWLKQAYQTLHSYMSSGHDDTGGGMDTEY